MPGHTFATPAGGSYTTQVFLNPALVLIQKTPPVAIQRVAEVESGALWVFQLSPARPQTIEVTITDLQEGMHMGLHGYLALVAFIQDTLNYSAVPFDVLHADNVLTRVRYLHGLESFQEAAGSSGVKGRWSGQLMLRKVV